MNFMLSRVTSYKEPEEQVREEPLTLKNTTLLFYALLACCPVLLMVFMVERFGCEIFTVPAKGSLKDQRRQVESAETLGQQGNEGQLNRTLFSEEHRLQETMLFGAYY